MKYRLTRNVRVGKTDGVYASGDYDETSPEVKAIKADKILNSEKGLLVPLPEPKVVVVEEDKSNKPKKNF